MDKDLLRRNKLFSFFFFLFYLENKKGLVVGEGCSLAEQGSDLSFKP